MLRSLFAAVSGLRAHQTMMDVVGNNIANVNTAGYKSTQTVFEDTLSQVLRSAGSPQGTIGGTNPAQVGLGTSVGGIATNFSQGAIQMTGRPTDAAIQGDGFFVVSKDNQTLYSRAGAFSFDANGNLVNPDGAVVQGWMAKNGVIDTNGPLTAMKLPTGQTLAPTATSTVDLGGNLPSDAATGTAITASITTYDQQGSAIPVTFTFTKTAADTWTVDADMPTTTGGTETTTQTLTWDPVAQTFSPATMSLSPTSAVGVFGSPLTVNLGTAAEPMTQYAGTNSIAALSQDGSGMGSMQSFTMSPDGTLIGVFSNGLKQAIGRLAVATFNNPPGLEKVGGSLYQDTVNSGVAAVGTAGNGGRGTLSSGTLEMSNVDLAQEFTNLIIAQRGFQANSRVVTSSDEILQDLVNMKR